MAVNSALTVLSWFENLPDEEQPPRHIWYDDQKVAEWFEKVRDKRRNPKKRSSYDEATDVPMSQNELAADYKKAMGIS